jgi:hypothetical protein
MKGVELYIDAPVLTNSSSNTVTQASLIYWESMGDGGSLSLSTNLVVDSDSGATLTAAGVWTDKPSTRERKKDIAGLDAAAAYAAIQQITPSTFEYDALFTVPVVDAEGNSRGVAYPNKGGIPGARVGIIAEDLPAWVRPPGDTRTDGVSGSMLGGASLALIRSISDRLDRAGIAV